MKSKKYKILYIDTTEKIEPFLSLYSSNQENKNRWDLTLINSTIDAYSLILSNSYDILLIGDIKRENLASNTKLLKYSLSHSKETINIVISFSDDDNTIPYIPLVHRIVSFSRNLFNNLESSLIVFNSIDQKKLKHIISKTTMLPSIPTVINKLLNNIEDKEFSIKDSIKLILQDQSLCANIIKYINNSNGKFHVSSIEQAVTLLGLNSVKAIAIMSLLDSYNDILKRYPQLQPLLTLSQMANKIIQYAEVIYNIEVGNQSNIEEIYATSILMDIGKIILSINFPEKYCNAMIKAHKNSVDLSYVESAIFGLSHAEVGGYLLSMWGFEPNIVKNVTYHEDPQALKQPEFTPLWAIYFAKILVNNSDIKSIIKKLPKDVHITSCIDRVDIWIKECNKIDIQ